MVECGSKFIRFSIKTEKPFRGKVFVKGQHGNKNCSRNFSASDPIYTSHSTSGNSLKIECIKFY